MIHIDLQIFIIYIRLIMHNLNIIIYGMFTVYTLHKS